MASNQLKDVSSNRSDQGGVTFITANFANSSIAINGSFGEGENTLPSSITINGWRYDFSSAQPSEVSELSQVMKEIREQPFVVSELIKKEAKLELRRRNRRRYLS